MESRRLAGSALSSPSTLPHGRFACFQCHDFSVCLIDIFVFFPDGGITATVLVHSDFSSRLPAPLSLSLSGEVRIQSTLSARCFRVMGGIYIAEADDKLAFIDV